MTMKNDLSFEGVFTLMLTPFNKDGEIDSNVYDQYVDWQLASNPNGLFAVCGSSEMKWLTMGERLILARQTVNRAGKTPVLATANLSSDIAEHEDEVCRVVDTGVSGIVLVPPPHMGEDQERLCDYFAKLSSVADCPVFLYEWPQTNPYFISPKVWGKLTNQYGIKGIKDTTCTMEGIRAKLNNVQEKSVVFQANTPFMLDSIAAGANGIMATTSTACSELVVDFWREACQDPSSQMAKMLHQYLVGLDSVLRFGYPVAAKYLVQLQGIPMELYSRWPVEWKTETEKAVSLFWDVYKKLK